MLKKSANHLILDKEIKLIEDKLNYSNLTELAKLIDELKYKIEIVLFSNKSSFFMIKEQSILFWLL